MSDEIRSSSGAAAADNELEDILRQFSTSYIPPQKPAVEPAAPAVAPAVEQPAAPAAEVELPLVVEEPATFESAAVEPSMPQVELQVTDEVVTLPLIETEQPMPTLQEMQMPILAADLTQEEQEAIPVITENAPAEPAIDSIFSFLQIGQEEQADLRGGKGKKPAAPDTKGKKIGRMAAKIAMAVFIPLLCLCVVLLSIDAVLCLGPSDAVRSTFVNTVMETSAAKFLAQMWLSDEEIAAIKAQNTPIETDEQVDADLIQIDGDKSEEDLNKIEIVEVSGGSFKGKMMIVHDPSRVALASLKLSNFGKDTYGKKVSTFVKENNAIAGINAGGFVDTNGKGRGGLPMGLVIKDGRAWHGRSKDFKYSVVGLTKDHKLVVGKMTADAALKKGVVDAVSFGPVLIMNGERMEITGNGSGLNPRTCLGQRADGAMLLLVIDGRHPDSIGASLEDCIDVMEDFGAVNAGNLDGGSSTVMYYNGKIINNCASIYGPRNNPTAFIVK